MTIDVLALLTACVSGAAAGFTIREVCDGKTPSLSLTLANLVLAFMNAAIVWLAMHK